MEFTMSVKNNQCVVTTSIDENARELFEAMARSLDVSCNVILRRLVRYFLDGKMSWNELFGKYAELPGIDTPNMPRKKQVRTTLAPEDYSTFARRVEELGSTTSIVIRRLILLYIAGKIERRDIW
jgi:hypothetical protein